MKRSPVATLPDVTGIEEDGEDLIDVLALGDVDDLANFLNPEMLRVSLVILQKLDEIPSQGVIFLR